MLTHLLIAHTREEIVDATNACTEWWPTGKMPDLDRLKFNDEHGSWYWEFVGVPIQRIPHFLHGLRIDQVILYHRMFLSDQSQALRNGSRKSKLARAWVESSVPPGQNPTAGNVQYVTVWANGLLGGQSLLDAANELTDQIFTEIKPAPLPEQPELGLVRPAAATDELSAKILRLEEAVDELREDVDAALRLAH